MAKYNHAYTIAFEVISDDPDGADFGAWREALMARVNQPEDELRAAYEADAPFDTFEEDES